MSALASKPPHPPLPPQKNATDPTSPDVLQADRMVAAATRKAVAVAHALSASQAQIRLASPEANKKDAA